MSDVFRFYKLTFCKRGTFESQLDHSLSKKMGKVKFYSKRQLNTVGPQSFDLCNISCSYLLPLTKTKSFCSVDDKFLIFVFIFEINVSDIFQPSLDIDCPHCHFVESRLIDFIFEFN